MTDVALHSLEMTVNGEQQNVICSPGETLLDVLRDRLGLTGAKFGCGIGYCGACTVLIDGEVAHACCLLAATLSARNITTVEGLAGDELNEVQESFLDCGAVQCGYCTPGFVVSIRGLRNSVPEPTEVQARAFLNGNICRCTGFAAIVRAACAPINPELAE
jgi:aerobic carbon-monoxide dehydrogenase small subunit